MMILAVFGPLFLWGNQMAVSDWSTTPGDNTSISGINIGEGCPPANINNAIRQMMTDVKAMRDGIDTGSGNQPADPTLSGIAATSPTANTMIYATGNDVFATTALTAFARTLLDDGNAATARATIGAAQAPTVSGNGTSGYVDFGVFKIAWKDTTVAPNSNNSYPYSTSFSSFARAWFSGGSVSTDAEENNPFVSSSGLSSAQISSARDGAVSGVLFAMGV